jgi:hypothetical protein
VKCVASTFGLADLLLHWWARNRPVRAKDAAVTLLGLEPLAAALAVVEKLTRVGGHRLTGLMTTVGAGKD